MLIFFSVGLLYLVKSGWRVTRRQGVFALTSYLAFIATVVAKSWNCISRASRPRRRKGLCERCTTPRFREASA